MKAIRKWVLSAHFQVVPIQSKRGAGSLCHKMRKDMDVETKAHCKEWKSVAKVWKDETAQNGGGAAKVCKLKRTS